MEWHLTRPARAPGGLGARSGPGRTLQPDRSGAGTASLPPAVPGIGTGVPPGSHRGRGHLEKLGETDRNDAWWLIPILQATGLVLLIGYANYAAFLELRTMRDEAQQRLGKALPILSMGMSDDFEAAVAAGSTMVRLGRILFGPRP